MFNELCSLQSARHGVYRGHGAENQRTSHPSESDEGAAPGWEEEMEAREDSGRPKTTRGSDASISGKKKGVQYLHTSATVALALLVVLITINL